MDNYLELKKGNLIEYLGRLGHRHYVEIDKIENQDADRYPIWFSPRFEWEKKFMGYSDEILPITLRRSHLQAIGFSFDPKSRRYGRGKILLGEFASVAGPDPMRLTFTDWGIRHIAEVDAPLRTPDDLEKYTHPLPYLHALQNYLASIGEKEIDYSVIW